MLLRMLWSRLGAQQVSERTPAFITASTTVFQSLQHQRFESKPRTLSRLWIFTKTLHQQHLHKKHTPSAFVGGRSLNLPLLINSDLLTSCRTGAICCYSANIVKSVLKSTLKATPVPGKWAPKGPRTKQPSRANQPSVSEDKVIHPVLWSFHLFL